MSSPSKKGVAGIDEIKTRLFGAKVYVDVEIAADGSQPLTESHQIAEKGASRGGRKLSGGKALHGTCQPAAAIRKDKETIILRLQSVENITDCSFILTCGGEDTIIKCK